MATASGTATGFNDLYAKLRDFLTTNAALVAAGQNWECIAGPATGALTPADSLVLQGPGTTGDDEILVSLEPNVSVGSDYYNLGIGGLVSYNPGVPVADQANKLTPRYLHLWDQPMPYWFIANGRRFIVVIRVTTVYQSAYAGFILPYHLPSTWAYPLFIGACSNNPTQRYSLVNNGNHSAFFNPGTVSAAIRLPGGTWCNLANKNHSSNEVAANVNNIAPWGQWFGIESRRDGLDGGYKPIPAEITISDPMAATLGALQGVYWVPGYGTGSENTFVADGKTYMVVQNTYRTSNNEYCALLME